MTWLAAAAAARGNDMRSQEHTLILVRNPSFSHCMMLPGSFSPHPFLR